MGVRRVVCLGVEVQKVWIQMKGSFFEGLEEFGETATFGFEWEERFQKWLWSFVLFVGESCRDVMYRCGNVSDDAYRQF